MSLDPSPNEQLAIAHVLFLDIVGYSKLLVNQQGDLLRLLNEIVRNTEAFRTAEAADKLVRLPTGDGMALAFFTSPDAPVRCAMEIDRRLKEHAQLNVRMGIHSGPVDAVQDVNDRTNIAGAGINMAQRVMDCGDGGHILLSKRIADDLGQYERWQPFLYDLGECEVKHGVRVEVVNLYTGEVGREDLPEKFKQKQRAHAALESRAAVLRRRKLLASSALVFSALVLIGAWFYWRPLSSGLGVHRPLSATESAKMVAILPFKPLVPEARDQVLEMGMADSLITKLSGSGDMIVPSLTSVRAYAALDQDPIEAGRKLGVTSVLEGNVQRAGDQLRVTVRLIKVSDGSSLWSGTFDEKFTDVFTVQDTISRKVAEALSLRLNAEEQKRLMKRSTENLDAYQLYLTGRFHWNKLTPPEIAKSIDFFQQAVGMDPNYALAYFGLAEAYRTLAIVSDLPPREIFPKAKAAAEKALQIDESLAEPHSTLAMVHMWFDWDWAASEREAKRAITLNPNSSFSHMALAQLLSTVGRHDEAIREAARARELDPVSLINNTREGALLYLARRYDEARARLQKTLELDPNFWIAQLYLGKVLLEQGKHAEALAAFEKAIEFSRGSAEAISIRGYFYARTGDQEKARAALEQLQILAQQRYVPAYHFALIYGGLGSMDEAVTWLEKGLEDRDVRLTWLKNEPSWDSSRSDARVLQIIRRVGLD